MVSFVMVGRGKLSASLKRSLVFLRAVPRSKRLLRGQVILRAGHGIYIYIHNHGINGISPAHIYIYSHLAPPVSPDYIYVAT